VIRRAALTLLALLLAAPAFAGPLTLLPTGHWATPVRINGEGPFEFVVDTAAANSAVFPSVRERLALAGSGRRVQVNGASGRQSFELFRLDSLELDGRTGRNLAAIGLDAIPEDRRSGGLVGADMLSRFVAEFDMPAGALRLHDPGTRLSGDWQVVPLTIGRSRFAALEGRLDGRPIVMILDTGARRTVVNWAAAVQAGVAPDAADLRPSEPVRGATNHYTKTVNRDFRSLSAGPVALSADAVHIADLSVFEQLGFGGRPAMILGIDRLRTLRFAIDYPAHRLMVERRRIASR
jgi:predicted aspartyl protease